MTFYKGARLDGYDFYTGKTINYRENIGKTVRVKNFEGKPELCSNAVLHAGRKPNDIFVGSGIPCAVFIVKGKPVIEDSQKCGFKELTVSEEIPQEKLDGLFGWRYNEVCNPINPFKIKPPKIEMEQIELLKNWDSVRDLVWDSVWASVRDSVWDSVWASVWDLVWASVWASVWDLVWASVWASVRDSVWDSVWASVRNSVWDSVGAYVGSLFPNTKKWKHTKHKRGEYPFQSAVDLWRQGLVASFDGQTWRLHGESKGKVLYEITKKELQKEAK